MNNLNIKQKIILIIVMAVIIVGGYCIYVKEQNNYNQGELEVVQTELLDEQKEQNNEEKIKIHVSGAVNKEGVIELEVNSRISDAIDKAGGLRNDAYIDQINLAYKLEDGMKIYIPNIKEKEQMQKDMESLDMLNTTNSYVITSSGTKIEQNDQQSNKNRKVNINTATQTELETLPGIGPSTALKIINYRNETGKFKTIEEIKNVSGIGESKFSKIKDFIDVK